MTNENARVYFYQEHLDESGMNYVYGIQLVIGGEVKNEEHIYKTGQLNLTRARIIEVGRITGEDLAKRGIKEYEYHPFEKFGNNDRVAGGVSSNVVFFRENLKDSIDSVINGGKR